MVTVTEVIDKGQDQDKGMFILNTLTYNIHIT